MWIDELADDAIGAPGAGPLHAQLSAALRDGILDGALPAGTRLPTEAELQDRFGISRSVVRQALLALTAEGLIERGRGRGSVVAPRSEHHRLVQRSSGLQAQLSDVTTAVLRLEPDDDAPARAALGAAQVFVLRRLRFARGEPIAVIETWLPARFGAQLTTAELTDASLHAVLRERHGIDVVAGTRQVRAVAASEALADQLGVEIGAPLLLLTGTSVDGTGAPIEMFRTWHRADRVVFDIDVLPGSGARTAAFDEGVRSTDAAASAPSSEGDLAMRARTVARELAELADQLGRL